MTHNVAIIGTGPDPSDPDRDGYAMGYRHGHVYANNERCELVACADIVPEHGRAFARTFDLGADAIYEDYEAMIGAVQPDIVSVCVPPGAHAEIAMTCAESGHVSAIHCEKPMADTWADSKAMVQTCDRSEVQLTINHQRRFGTPFRKAKRLLQDGTIGDLHRIEFTEETLFDAGTHLFDLCRYFTDEVDVEWVLAQVDYREENCWFGTPNATQAVTQWRYVDGTMGIATTGDSRPRGAHYLCLVGENGVIQIGVDNGPTLRYRQDDSTWTTVDTDGETIHGRGSPAYADVALRKLRARLPFLSTEDRRAPLFIERAIADVIEGLETGTEPELAGRDALRATELIFASWESARRRGRVDLPLDIEDNPLVAMIESGQLGSGTDRTVPNRRNETAADSSKASPSRQ